MKTNKRGSGPSGRTPAARVAIDARAVAWVRPMSAAQRNALQLLAKGSMHRVRIGFVSNHGPGHVPIAVMSALAKRGYATLSAFEAGATITPAGRREARRL